MENFRPPFEPGSEPGKAGSVEGGKKETDKKKEKKARKVSKSSGILPKVEADEGKAADKEKEVKNEPGSALEKLLAKETDKKESKPDDAEVEESETRKDIIEESQEVIPEQPFETLEEEPIDLPDTLEGEFAEEGTIIARAEAPKTAIKEPMLEDTAEPEKAATEPVESPGGDFEQSRPPFDTPLSFETPSTEEFAAVAEGTSREETVPTPLHEQPMFDPNIRYEQAALADRERRETAEPMIARSEHEREVYYARKRATSRGVVAGGVAGYWLGRRGRKDAEKEAKAAHETISKQDKKLERLEAEQAMAKERFKNIENTKAELVSHTKKIEQPPISVEISKTIEAEPVFAAPKAAPLFEKQPTSQEKLPSESQQAPEEQPITEETYQPPTGRRVETSSWHRYEVDEKTGKVVENPELAYGEEFQKEQRQEKLQRPATEPHVAVQLGAAVVQNTSVDDVAQATATDVMQPQQEAKSSDVSLLKDKTYIKQQLVRRTTDPATWIIALGLVVFLFLAGIL